MAKLTSKNFPCKFLFASLTAPLQSSCCACALMILRVTWDDTQTTCCETTFIWFNLLTLCRHCVGTTARRPAVTSRPRDGAAPRRLRDRYSCIRYEALRSGRAAAAPPVDPTRSIRQPCWNDCSAATTTGRLKVIFLHRKFSLNHCLSSVFLCLMWIFVDWF